MSRLAPSLVPSRVFAIAVLLMGAVIATTFCPALVLAMGPALMLFLLLLAGVHPGERTIERLRSRRRRREARWTRAPRVRRPHVTLVVRRVRQPLARALTTRPPPAPRAVFS